MAQDVKNFYDIKRNPYTESLAKTYMTPKKLMEVRNKSTNPYGNSLSRDVRNEIVIREYYKPSSLQPFTLKQEHKEKSDSLQNIINRLAYV